MDAVKVFGLHTPSRIASLLFLRRALVRRMSSAAAAAGGPAVLEIVAPDDWHHHLRDGDALRSLVPLAAAQFSRAIALPNLKPP